MRSDSLRKLFLALICTAALGCGETSPGGAASTPDLAPEDAANAAHTHDLRTFGRDLDHAVEIAPGVYQARGTGNAHVIATAAGRVVRVVYGRALPGGAMRSLAFVSVALPVLVAPRPDPIMELFGADAPEGVVHAVCRGAEGCAVEFAIPTAVLDAARGAARDALRVNVSLADFDAGQTNHSTLHWRADRFGGQAPEGSRAFLRR